MKRPHTDESRDGIADHTAKETPGTRTSEIVAEEIQAEKSPPRQAPTVTAKRDIFDIFGDEEIEVAKPSTPPPVVAVSVADDVSQESIGTPVMPSAILYDEYDRFVSSCNGGKILSDNNNADVSKPPKTAPQSGVETERAEKNNTTQLPTPSAPVASSSSSKSSSSSSSTSSSSHSSSSSTSSSSASSTSSSSSATSSSESSYSSATSSAASSRSPSATPDQPVAMLPPVARSPPPPPIDIAISMPSAESSDDEILGRVEQLKQYFLAKKQQQLQQKQQQQKQIETATADNIINGELPEQRPAISLVIAPRAAIAVQTTKMKPDTATDEEVDKIAHDASKSGEVEHKRATERAADANRKSTTADASHDRRHAGDTKRPRRDDSHDYRAKERRRSRDRRGRRDSSTDVGVGGEPDRGATTTSTSAMRQRERTSRRDSRRRHRRSTPPAFDAAAAEGLTADKTTSRRRRSRSRTSSSRHGDKRRKESSRSGSGRREWRESSPKRSVSPKTAAEDWNSTAGVEREARSTSASSTSRHHNHHHHNQSATTTDFHHDHHHHDRRSRDSQTPVSCGRQTNLPSPPSSQSPVSGAAASPAALSQTHTQPARKRALSPIELETLRGVGYPTQKQFNYHNHNPPQQQQQQLQQQQQQHHHYHHGRARSPPQSAPKSPLDQQHPPPQQSQYNQQPFQQQQQHQPAHTHHAHHHHHAQQQNSHHHHQNHQHIPLRHYPYHPSNILHTLQHGPHGGGFTNQHGQHNDQLPPANRPVHIPRVVTTPGYAVVAGHQGGNHTWSELYGRPYDAEAPQQQHQTMTTAAASAAGVAEGPSAYVFNGPPPSQSPLAGLAFPNLIEIRSEEPDMSTPPPSFVLQKGNVLEIVPKVNTPSLIDATTSDAATATTSTFSSKPPQDQPSTQPPATSPQLPLPPPIDPVTAALRARRKSERDKRRVEKFMRKETLRVRLRELVNESVQLSVNIREALSKHNAQVAMPANVSDAVEVGAHETDVNVAAATSMASESKAADTADAEDETDINETRHRYNPLASTGKSCLRQEPPTASTVDTAADGPPTTPPPQTTPAKEPITNHITGTITPPPTSAPATAPTRLVLFADGVRPGDGTSDSDGDDPYAPLPLRSRNKRAILRFIERKRSAKRAARRALVAQTASAVAAAAAQAAAELAELENLTPPPPPPGDPPAHLPQPKLKRRAPSTTTASAAAGGGDPMPELIYFHYNPRDNRMYVSSDPDPNAAFQKQLMQTPPPTMQPPHMPPPAMPPHLLQPPPSMHKPPPSTNLHHSHAVGAALLTNALPPPPMPPSVHAGIVAAMSSPPPHMQPSHAPAAFSRPPPFQAVTQLPTPPPQTQLPQPAPTTVAAVQSPQHIVAPVGLRRRMTFTAEAMPHHQQQHLPHHVHLQPHSAFVYQQQQQQQQQQHQHLQLHQHRPPILQQPQHQHHPHRIAPYTGVIRKIMPITTAPPPSVPPPTALQPAPHYPRLLSPPPAMRPALLAQPPPPLPHNLLPILPMPAHSTVAPMATSTTTGHLGIFQRRNSVAHFGGSSPLLAAPLLPTPPRQALNTNIAPMKLAAPPPSASPTPGVNEVINHAFGLEISANDLLI